MLKNNILFLDSPLTYIKKIADCSHSKPFCFVDIKLYFKLLDDNLVQQLIDYIDVLLNSNMVIYFFLNE